MFIFLSALILAAWYWLAVPPSKTKDQDADEDKVAKVDKDKKTKATQTKTKDDKEKKPTKKTEPAKKPAVKPPVQQAKATVETIGGAGFHLTCDLTTRGAAVRRVVLNHFKAANWRGEPTDRELELVQDDEFAPSYRMYHYLDPGDANPVLGLGELIWIAEGKKAVTNEQGAVRHHEARYWALVPNLEQVKIVKTYRLAPTDYHVTLVVEMHDLRPPNNDSEPRPFRYQLTGAQGLPVEGEWYTATFRNSFCGLVDPRNSLWRKSEDSLRVSGRNGGDTWPDSKYDRGANRLQYAGVANQYFGAMIVVDDEQPDKKAGGVLAWARPTLETTEKRGILVKINPKDKSILFRDAKNAVRRYHLLPRTERHIDDLGLREGEDAVLSFYETPEPESKLVAAWIRTGTSLKPQFDDMTVRVNSEKVELFPGRPLTHQFMLYHGPVKVALLAQFRGDQEVPSERVTRYADTLHLRTLTDYPSDNILGKISSFILLTKIIIWFTTLMHWLLNQLHYVFGYGLSIVVLTVMVRGAMFPISRRQAMFSIKMQELAPELKKIQAKYPDDPQARMQAQQKFYREHGINPLASCWPIFLQMPIFLGLYFALQESIDFRLADFLWIKNLAAPDMLIYWTENIPVISSPDHGGFLGFLYLGPYLNILPMIAVVFMMIQQIQTMPPPTDEQTAMQQKMLKYMTVFFGIMFYKVAAGLCIYFIASSLWGMAERKLLPKKKTTPGVPESPGGTTGGGSSPGGGGKPSPNGPMSPKDKGKWAKKEKEKEKVPVTPLEKLKALWKEILKAAEKK
ncbi:MAG: membrane protein insertase YidC [Planctomycetes bacterium]|nr:membrane protein insertase YidC [Planctomycetota bacterium]